MKFSERVIYLLTIALLIAVVFLVRECQHCPEFTDCTDIDTVFVDKIVYKDSILPAPKPVHDTTHDSVFIPAKPIDTNVILRKYYTLHKYDRLLIDNKYATIRLQDSVYMNTLLGSKLSSEFYSHDTIIYVPKEVQPALRNKLFVFGGTGINLKLENPQLYAGVMFQTKKDHAYSVQYDPFNQNFVLNMYWKIRIKK